MSEHSGDEGPLSQDETSTGPRVRSLTEQGKKYQIDLLEKNLQSLERKLDKKQAEVLNLFGLVRDDSSRAVVSSSLSELTILKIDLRDNIERLTALTDENHKSVVNGKILFDKLVKFLDAQINVLSSVPISLPSVSKSCTSRSDKSRVSSGNSKVRCQKSKRSIASNASSAHILAQREIIRRNSEIRKKQVELEEKLKENKFIESVLNNKGLAEEDIKAILGPGLCTFQPEKAGETLMPPYQVVPVPLTVPITSSQPNTEPVNMKHGQPQSITDKLPITSNESPKDFPIKPNYNTGQQSISAYSHDQLHSSERLPSQVDQVKPPVDLSCHSRNNLNPAIYMTKMQVLSSINPTKFDGSCDKFPIFKREVKTHLDDEILPDSVKQAFLSKFLSGEALRVYEINVGLSFSQYMELLEKRFGDKSAVVEAWVVKLTEGPAINTNDSKALLEFGDMLTTASTVLRGDDFTEISSRLCLKRIVSRLPIKFKVGWVKVVEGLRERETIKDLAEYVQGLSKIYSHPVYFGLDKVGGIRSKSTAKSHRTAVDSEHAPKLLVPDKVSVNESCWYCLEQANSTRSHSLNECRNFRKLAWTDKINFFKNKKLCFSCLSLNCFAKICKKRLICDVKSCGKKHPSCLHRDEAERTNVKPANLSVRSTSINKSPFLSRTTSFVIPVFIFYKDRPNQKILTYAMLDDGSNACFISSSLQSKLEVKGIQTRLQLTTMHQKSSITTYKLKGLVVSDIGASCKISLPDATYTKEFIPCDVSEIPTPSTIAGFSHLKSLSNILLPVTENTEVQILIGNNCPRALCPLEVLRGEGNEPYGVRTDLGWGVIGPKSVITNRGSSVIDSPVSANQLSVKEVLNLFNIHPDQEHLNHGLGLSINDKKFISKIEKGLVHRRDKHYEMPLPFKVERPIVPNNIRAAEARLRQLKNKFRNDKFRDDYTKFVSDMVVKGHAEEATDQDIEPGRLWYLPHHGVYHSKNPNKIRVVFDCSATYEGVSLNSCLISSPDLTNSLVGVLMRFRVGYIAFVGDIEGMFHQVVVPKRDRNFLRFLWWEGGDISKPPKHYRMTVHLFGASSSPGCSNYALRRTAQDYGEKVSPRAAKFIKENFYVDDGCGSVDTVDEAVQLIKDLQSLCLQGGFRFHKLLASNTDVIRSIPKLDRAEGFKEFELFNDIPLERALGVAWCVETDSFQFRVVINEKPRTRRGILSTVCSVYDPLGILSPFTIVGKFILQELCRAAVENKTENKWDEPIPLDLETRWERWLSDLKLLSKNIFEMPRCIKPLVSSKINRIELHHFSDASVIGYGHASYIRYLYDDTRVHCSFLFGKARVRPLREITVPRLELTAAVTMAKAGERIERELGLEVAVKQYYWTDSKVVLGYIKNEKRRFHIFVANRVQTIRDCSAPHDWHHIGSKENVADLASRGASVDQLRSSRWILGPAFLWESNSLPETSSNENYDIEIDDPEVRKEVGCRAVHCIGSNYEMDELFARVSSWSRLRRCVAIFQRYMHCIQQRIRGQYSPDIIAEPISASELYKAGNSILVVVQKEHFSSLAKNEKLKPLNPVVCKEGLLRLGGRIKHSLLPEDVKHPIILPQKSHVTTLIIRYCHEKVHHQGRGVTMNELRSRGYWVIGASSEVAKLIKFCVPCRKLRGGFETQLMADLPKDRVEPAPPFTNSAVDVFGPFYVRQGRKQIKRYGIVFTCLACRAVHLDTLDTLDTNSYINALRRFICRRGVVKLLRSDMGTNFVGARQELKRALEEVDTQAVRKYLAEGLCEFRFNVPQASHMNGAVERQIGTVRRILDYLLGTHRGLLNEDGLRTLLAECEGIINGRPLTVDSISDPDSLAPLTPNHLLTLKPASILPPPGNFRSEDLYSRRRWRSVQHLSNEFWCRWRNEYLQSLQRRNKWQHTQRNLSVGDIVLCRDDSMPRNLWLLARVTQTMPSQDGRIRKVRIRLGSSGTDLERPIHRLILLVPGGELQRVHPHRGAT